jgi:hypothetical protein
MRASAYILEVRRGRLARERPVRDLPRQDQTHRNRARPAAARSNAEAYTLLGSERELGHFHVVYDIDETRLAIELNEDEADKFYRLMRDQRIITPDLGLIRRVMSGNMAETVAAVLWQIGDQSHARRPAAAFKVDEDGTQPNHIVKARQPPGERRAVVACSPWP